MLLWVDIFRQSPFFFINRSCFKIPWFVSILSLTSHANLYSVFNVSAHDLYIYNLYVVYYDSAT